MGANGAGKSTLVKILTGAIRPDSGTIAVRGRERVVHSPGEARRGGLVSVYQEPALIPDLDIRVQPAADRDAARAVPPLARTSSASTASTCRPSPRRVPLASLRIIDLARALAIEPDVLMLDEMTAALPANLTERVLEVIGRQRGGDRCVIFISHRMIEIAAVCDRATVLREGVTVGVVDVTAGSEDRIVELMLGQAVEDAGAATAAPRAATRARTSPRGSRPREPQLAARSCRTPRSTSTRARCSGVVALEGQGQDELFDILAGSERPSGGELLVDGSPVVVPAPGRRDPCGRSCTSPADRAEALLMQRSVRENIALPFTARVRQLGPDRPRHASGAQVDRRDRDAPDRHARQGRGPPAVGRQPAEGDDRPLGGGRRPDDALLRPDPRHRHPDQAPDLRAAPRPRRRRAPRSCCTRRSSRRSSSPATARS